MAANYPPKPSDEDLRVLAAQIGPIAARAQLLRQWKLNTLAAAQSDPNPTSALAAVIDVVTQMLTGEEGR